MFFFLTLVCLGLSALIFFCFVGIQAHYTFSTTRPPSDVRFVVVVLVVGGGYIFSRSQKYQPHVFISNLCIYICISAAHTHV